MDVESCICANIAWQQLPDDIKIMLGGSQKEYDKLIVEYSVKNQLRHKGNLVRHIRKDAEAYYDAVIKYSAAHMMLFPYHLADIVVKELRITPFNYYVHIIIDMVNGEKSYDNLPNFTAADAMRLLGVGRNQYIDLMNQNRSNRRLFRRNKTVRELLPSQPVPQSIEPWYLVQSGCILEADIKTLNNEEKKTIDLVLDLPDPGAIPAGLMDHRVLQSLFHKGLIYFDVPVKDDDYIYVGPLDGFVMNRVMGDYFETLLYKIFVTIDGMTTVAEIAEMLHIDVQLVKNASSVFCRLGFAKKRVTGMEGDKLHVSWSLAAVASPPLTPSSILVSTPTEGAALGPASPNSIGSPGSLAGDLSECLKLDEEGEEEDESGEGEGLSSSTPAPSAPVTSDVSSSGRIAFLFDANLTAFLMMGNLSASLKSHAVTLFEVGKLTDEQLKDFMEQLENVNRITEGEAQRFSEHATTLLYTLKSLRSGTELDLIRGESLLSLDAQSRARVLHKSYCAIVAMAPLIVDACALPLSALPLLGPPIPEACSPWFRLALYSLTSSGLRSIFVPKGTRLPHWPSILQGARRLLVTSLNQAEPQILSASSALFQVNELLTASAIFIQEYCHRSLNEGVVHVPFPFNENDEEKKDSMANHPAVAILRKKLGLGSLCGYCVLVRNKPSLPSEDSTSSLEVSSPSPYAAVASFSTPSKRRSTLDSDVLPSGLGHDDFSLLDVVLGVPLFDDALNRTICQRLHDHSILGTENRVSIQFANKAIIDLTMDLIAKHNYGITTSGAHGEKVEVVAPVRAIGFDHSRASAEERGIVLFSPVEDPN